MVGTTVIEAPNEAIKKSIRLPRHRLRSSAEWIFKSTPADKLKAPAENLIEVVCISDTHNRRPPLPPGDLLVHAGDLTNDGSFDEIQTQLDWLSSQPHRHKVIIAGNHDILLDREFMAMHPERDYPSNAGRIAKDLDFGSVKYLCNESITLEFPRKGADPRTLSIYGCPVTPVYGTSAFQIPREADFWTDRVPEGTDVLLTHGPPFKHLDGAFASGCRDLATEVEGTRPGLVVFGHIHVGYGQEKVCFSGIRKDYESVRAGTGGWITIVRMVLRLSWLRITPRWFRAETRQTMLVNAAVVGGKHHEYSNPPIVAKI